MKGFHSYSLNRQIPSSYPFHIFVLIRFRVASAFKWGYLLDQHTGRQTDRHTHTHITKDITYPDTWLVVIPIWTHTRKRLHSSRMHTVRLLPVSPSMHCAGGGVCSPRGQGGRGAGGGCGIPVCTEADPPCEQNDRQVQKYYLAPNFVCGR